MTVPDTPNAVLGAALASPVASILKISENLASPGLEEDIGRIRRNATRLEEICGSSLSPQTPFSEDALHKVRHDIRGVLGNIQNFAQLLQFEDDISPDFEKELESLLTLTRCCSAELNANRDNQAAKSPPPTRTPKKRKRSTTAAGSPEPSPNAARILIVDDDPDSRGFISKLLAKHGHSLDEAIDGRVAVDKIAKTDYDLVLLDINMPEMNGIQVLEHLRDKNMLNHTPVLIISGEDTGDNIIRCIELGAEDFFPRDFDQRLLIARVNACLEKQKLRERAFHQYFTPELARKLVRHPELLTEGTKREVSILFCDIVRFSAISLQLGPIDTIRWLSDVMGELSDCVIAEGGVLVDYTGDELMAMWGAPNQQHDHAERACRTAQAITAKLPAISKRWSELVGEPTDVAMGINSGEAFVGNVGTGRKFKYGALGTPVNLASRLEGATKYLRTRTLISGATRAAISSRKFRTRHLCDIQVKNIDLPVAVHELADRSHPNWAAFRRSYEKALSHFENREFHKASSVLGNLLVKYPTDGPSLLLMSRVVESLLLESPEDFDPVWTLPGK